MKRRTLILALLLIAILLVGVPFLFVITNRFIEAVVFIVNE